MKIEKPIFRYIEHELRCFEDYKKMLENYNGELALNGKFITTSQLFHMTQVVIAVIRALNMLTDTHREIYNLHYRQNKHCKAICEQLNFTMINFFRIRRELIFSVGYEMGLIKPTGNIQDNA